jgi:hypothetical protein
MNLHRNSVQYVIQQATALLPEASRDLRDDLDVRIALTAVQWLGPLSRPRPLSEIRVWRGAFSWR